MVQRRGHYEGVTKNTGSIRDIDMEKDGACKTDRQNKKCSCAKSIGEGRKKMQRIKKRKRNWLGHWLRRNCSRRNAKREESSRQKKISNDRQHYGIWTV